MTCSRPFSMGLLLRLLSPFMVLLVLSCSPTPSRAQMESLEGEKGLTSRSQSDDGQTMLHTIWVTSPFEKKPAHFCAYGAVVALDRTTGEPLADVEPTRINAYSVTLGELTRESRAKWLFSALAQLPVKGLSQLQELIPVGDPEFLPQKLRNFEANRRQIDALILSLKAGNEADHREWIELAGGATVLTTLGADFQAQDPAMKYKVPNFRTEECPTSPVFNEKDSKL